MVVVFVFTPAPPWIPHSTRLSFEVIIDMIQKQRHLHMLEKHYNEMSNCEVRRSFRCVATTLALDDERPVTRSGVRQRSATYRDICGLRIEMVRLLHIMENTFRGPLTSLSYGILSPWDRSEATAALPPLERTRRWLESPRRSSRVSWPLWGRGLKRVLSVYSTAKGDKSETLFGDGAGRR